MNNIMTTEQLAAKIAQAKQQSEQYRGLRQATLGDGATKLDALREVARTQVVLPQPVELLAHEVVERGVEPQAWTFVTCQGFELVATQTSNRETGDTRFVFKVHLFGLDGGVIGEMIIGPRTSDSSTTAWIPTNKDGRNIPVAFVQDEKRWTLFAPQSGLDQNEVANPGIRELEQAIFSPATARADAEQGDVLAKYRASREASTKKVGSTSLNKGTDPFEAEAPEVNAVKASAETDMDAIIQAAATEAANDK